MRFRFRILHNWIGLALLGCVLACSGMTSGGSGGASPVSGGGGSIVGGQNSLDGGNFATGGGGSGSGDGSGGEDQGGAVPSTQESNPAIGGPCGIAFVVKVKVIRDGLEQSCSAVDAGTIARIRLANVSDGDTGTMAPPEDPPPGPIVKFDFENNSGIGEPRRTTAPTSCAADGRWTTKRDDLHFFYVPAEPLKCSLIQVKTHAEWGSGFVVNSNEFTGPPFSDLDESVGAIPIEVTLDLGFSKPGAAAVAQPAVLGN